MVNPLRVDCPFCRAVTGERCYVQGSYPRRPLEAVDPRTGVMRRGHDARIELAEAAADVS